jgi:WD40 repeat protein
LEPVSAARIPGAKATPSGSRSSLSLVAALVAAVVLLATTVVLVIWLASIRQEVARERSRAEAAEQEQARFETDLQKMTKAADDNKTAVRVANDRADSQAATATQNARQAEQVLAQTRYQLQRQMYLAQIARAESLWDRDPARGLALLDDKDICPPDQRDFAWGFYRKLCTTELATLKGHEEPVYLVAVSPNGKIAASAAGQTIKLWNLEKYKELATLSGHEQPITELQFSPNGNLLASRCGNPGKAGELFLWNISQPEKSAGKKLEGHEAPITAMTFSRDGKLLASCSAEENNLGKAKMEARIWETESGKQKRSFEVPEIGLGFMSIALSPDGKQFAVGSGGRAGAGAIHVVEIESGRDLQTFKGHNGWITALAFAGNNTLISGSRESDNPKVKIWDLDTGKDRATMSLETEKDGVVAVRLLGDGKIFAAWTKIEVKLWDLNGVQQSLALTGPLSADAVAFSADGNTLALPHVSEANNVDIAVWDVPSAKDRGSFHYKGCDVRSLVFAPDGQMLVSGWSDGAVRLLSARTAQESSSIPVHKPSHEQRTVLAVSPDGKYLASGGADGVVRLWNRSTGESQDLIGHSAPITCLAFSPDSMELYSGDRSKHDDSGGVVKVWNVATGEDTKRNEGDKVAEITAVAISPDGDRWAWGNMRGEVKIFSRSGKAAKEVVTNALTVNALAFSPDGKYLVIAVADQSIRIWNVTQRQDAFVIRGAHSGSVNSVAFSPDGKQFASVAGDEYIGATPTAGELKVWDVSTGKETVRMRGPKLRGTSVAFSADGKTIATSSSDGLIKLWDVVTGTEETTLMGRPPFGQRRPPTVTSVAFTPDGKTLYSADLAGVIKNWEVLRDK